MFHSSHGQAARTFAVSGTASAYADEVLYLGTAPAGALPKGRGELDVVSELQVYVESLPAAAEIEVDLLQADGDPNVAADWINGISVYNATGLQTILALAAWHGVRIRAQSGGTSGSAVVHVSWW